MGIRLSRDIKQRNISTSEDTENLNLVVTPGEDYNLDDISENRNRQSRVSPLILENRPVETQGISANGEDGEISIENEMRAEKPSTNQLDYIKYLLQDNQNKFFPHPPKYPERQIVDWEEGTEDNTCDDGNKDSLYYEFYQRMLNHMMEDEDFMRLLMEKFADISSKIDVIETDKPDQLHGPIVTVLYDESEALESNRIMKKNVEDNFYEFMIPFFADYITNNVEGEFYELVHKE